MNMRWLKLLFGLGVAMVAATVLTASAFGSACAAKGITAEQKLFRCNAAIVIGTPVRLRADDADWAFAYLNRGAAHADLGNTDKALADYATALELAGVRRPFRMDPDLARAPEMTIVLFRTAEDLPHESQAYALWVQALADMRE
jgi:tetratricopeptide (TPR) repeat protein